MNGAHSTKNQGLTGERPPSPVPCHQTTMDCSPASARDLSPMLSPRQRERRNERSVWSLREVIRESRTRGFAVSASRDAGSPSRHAAWGAGSRGRHAAGSLCKHAAAGTAAAGTAAGSLCKHAAAGSSAAGILAAGTPGLEGMSAEGRRCLGMRSRRRHHQGTRQSLAQASSS